MEVENQNINQEKEIRKEESYEVPAAGENDNYDKATQNLSLFGKLEQFAQNITIYGVGAYAVYSFCKEVVTSHFYPGCRPKTAIERIIELRESFATSIDEIKNDMAKLETEYRQVKAEVDNIAAKVHYMNIDLSAHCHKMKLQAETKDISIEIPAWQLS